MKILLFFLLLILVFEAGKAQGEINILTQVKMYIKESKNWDEFLNKISNDWNKYNL